MEARALKCATSSGLTEEEEEKEEDDVDVDAVEWCREQLVVSVVAVEAFGAVR